MASQSAQASRRRRPERRQARSRLPLAVLALLVVAGVVGAARAAGSPTSGGGAGSTSAATSPVDPALFHAGACISEAPTRGDRHLTVFLDAGHGGVDVGAVGTTESGTTIYEADETLPVELDAAALLRQAGFRVVVSRTADTAVAALTSADYSGGVLTLEGAHADVAARDECANRAHASLLVGIYFDAGGAGEAGSITTWDPDRPFSRESKRFATLLEADVVRAMNAHGWQIPNGGTPTDAGLGSSVPTSSTSRLAVLASEYHHIMLLGPPLAGYFSTPSEMPGALIEPLFITDPFEGSIAASPRGQRAIASGLATAVEQYFAPAHR